MIMFIIAALQLHYSQMYFNLLEAQLGDVANYVSSIAGDLVILVESSSNEDITLTKNLDTPPLIGYFGYYITMNNQKVEVFLERYSSVKGSAILPWVGGNLKIYDGTLVVSDVDPEETVSSRVSDLVIWCRKENGIVTVGLGFKEG